MDESCDKAFCGATWLTNSNADQWVATEVNYYDEKTGKVYFTAARGKQTGSHKETEQVNFVRVFQKLIVSVLFSSNVKFSLSEMTMIKLWSVLHVSLTKIMTIANGPAYVGMVMEHVKLRLVRDLSTQCTRLERQMVIGPCLKTIVL